VKPESFLPTIIHRLDRPKPWMEWLEGTVLFADISGFTPMAEALSAGGAEGAEILTNILNRYFAETIDIIHAAGGEVMKFGGDALVCLFSGPNSQNSAIAAASGIHAATSKYRTVRTPVKKFTLQVKIGIGSGDIMIAGIGDPAIRCDYLLAGNAVDRSVQAEHNASPGETAIAKLQKKPVTKILSTERSPLSTKDYLIAEVYEMIRLGYDRYVGALLNSAPAFLEFSGFHCQKKKFDLKTFHNFFNKVTSSAHRFGGRLNGVMMGDKGNNFLFYFGAPNPLEKKEKAALEWSLEIRDLIRTNFPEIKIKIGITEGKVFSGIVGGSGRFHFAVVGDCVNLAARLTQLASIDQICVSENLKMKESESFSFDQLGTPKVKGKAQPVTVYAVKAKTSHQAEVSEKFFFGRDQEIEMIWNGVNASVSGIPEMIIIEGRPGVGKTALCDRISRMCNQHGFTVLRASSEITRRNHPFTSWQGIFQSLALDLPVIHVEPDSIFQQDQKTRLHHLLSENLLKSLSNKKTLMILEDLHWFDSLSLEMLASFLNHLKNESLFILATTRPEWEKENFVNRSACIFMNLNELDKTVTADVAEALLDAPLKMQLLEFIYDRSQGNPFLLENLLTYLKEKDLLLMVAGKWSFKHEAERLENLSGSELVAAQIEKLSLPERIHLQSAACMGPTFSQRILSLILGKRFRKEIFQKLCTLGYFQNSDTEWTSFRQGLIQEAIYYSLPLKMRKRIHRRIAKAMETTLGKYKSLYLPNLANHFRLAGIRHKAVFYSLSASQNMLSSQSYPEASHYLEAAYHLTKNTNDKRKWDAALKFATALIHSGKTEKSFQISKELSNRAKRHKLWKIFFSASALQFDAMRRLSDYSYLNTALKLLDKHNSMDHQNRCKLLYLAGSAYFWLGKPDHAELALNEVLKLSIEDQVTISSYVFLASIYADRGKNEEAAMKISSALELAKNSGNKYQDIRIRHEWAGILSDSNHAEQAIPILYELLPKAEALGDFYLVGAILTSLGHAETNLGHWDTATSFITEATTLFKNLGMLHGHAQATMLKGVLAFYKNNYIEAYESYKQAAEFFEKAGENVEACHGYYNLAEVCWKRNKQEEAELWFNKGMKSFNAANNPRLARMYEELKKEFHH
jgi:class 3 adenylate cyclase/tetratricopeptide (TPR) repeat protein/archaellum biogenesis ATPase FlaH